MKIALPTLIAVVAFAGLASTAPAGTMEGHTIVAPQEIKWGPAPAVLPPGAQAAVLFGDPTKEGLFASGLSCRRAIAFLRIRIRSMRSSRWSPGRSVWGWERPPIRAVPSPCPRAVSSRFLQAPRTMSSSTKRRSYKSAPSVHGTQLREPGGRSAAEVPIACSSCITTKGRPSRPFSSASRRESPERQGCDLPHSLGSERRQPWRIEKALARTVERDDYSIARGRGAGRRRVIRSGYMAR